MPYKDPAKQKEAQKRYEEKRKKENGERHRTWMLIFYPDSAPEDWAEQISVVHLPVWVSPPHDRDVWTEADEKAERRKMEKEGKTGEPKHKAGTKKKDHYHLIAQYPEKVDRAHFLEDFKFLNGPESVKAVQSLNAMVRYLIHMDDPDKAQYERRFCRVFGGASLDVMDEISKAERHALLKAMRRYIRENNVLYFDEFVDYCDDSEIQWAHLLDDNSTYVIREYIKARAFRLEQAQRDFERQSYGKR